MELDIFMKGDNYGTSSYLPDLPWLQRFAPIFLYDSFFNLYSVLHDNLSYPY